jgi:hypothetical protein
MNDKKLNQLFTAAKKDAGPAAPTNFAADILRAARNTPPVHAAEGHSIFDQLNAWFPRLAFAAAAIIVLCVVAEYSQGTGSLWEPADSGDQFTSQFDQNGGDL